MLSPAEFAYYTGLGVLAVVELIEWPVALVVGLEPRWPAAETPAVAVAVPAAPAQATGVPRPAQILAGQCLGFAAWVGVSVLAAAGLRLIPTSGWACWACCPSRWGCTACSAHASPTPPQWRA